LLFSLFTAQIRVLRRKLMRRQLFGFTVATLCAIGTAVATQGPPQTPQTKPQPAQPAVIDHQTVAVTVEGCLMREQDVPGRQPNVAERTGILEDFILTNAKVIQGSTPRDASRTGQTKPAPGTDVARTAQSGAAQAGNFQPMYDVKEIDKEQLKPLAGKRVQIEGTWADTVREPSAGATEDLIDIRGVRIREVPGQCPPKP
jgi:hypothetical protein